ncbi:hypothetical protein [Microvirga yunnanensis]|uniref:hypothetical protein n=1 Tax=Microvirga yunnanensis TaxID=2953740 RepID=UPI0021C8895D|nr:hypothetical protein [Microvirga sp. HBU65207]
MSDGRELSRPKEPGGRDAGTKKGSRFDWIGLLAIAIALHGWHNGFRPVYSGDIIALAAVGLIFVVRREPYVFQP